MATNPEDAGSLRGFAVLVTRPAEQSSSLIDALQALGADVYVAPMLVIEAAPRSPHLVSVVQSLDGYDVVIVTSRNAVAHGMPLLADYWPQWPAAQCWLAVGEATAAALAGWHIHAQVPADARSEGLLAMPVLTDIRGKRVLLLTGEGGRGLLEDALAARGAQVTRLAVYRRVAPGRAGAPGTSEEAVTRSLPESSPESSPESAPRSGSDRGLAAFRDILQRNVRGAALVTSREALQNLLAQAPWVAGDAVGAVAVGAVIVAASARIADAARDTGCHRVVDAGGADDAHQLAALARLAQADHEDRA